MAADCAITNRLRRRQKTMFREAERQFGLTQKAVHLETGMSLTSLSEYARGLTTMSGEAIMKLAEWRDFLAEKADAEADGVVNLGEKRKLKMRARRIEVVARKVAAA